MEPIDIFNLEAQTHFEYEIRHRRLLFEDVAKRCESPIEQMMAAALSFHTCPGVGPEQLPKWRTNPDEDVAYLDEFYRNYVIITPQAPVAGYRVDFLITARFDGGRAKDIIAVECDGHEFHEKTKEQAARDKARDRTLVTYGLRVLRFTGSEIYRDPARCGRQVWLVVENTWVDSSQ